MIDPLSTRAHMIIRVTIIVIFIVYYCEACTINTRQMLYVFISLELDGLDIIMSI